MLLAASAALLDQPLVVAVRLAMPAATTAKSFGPQCANQISRPLGVRAETPDEGRQRPPQVPQQLVKHRALQPIVLSLLTLGPSCTAAKATLVLRRGSKHITKSLNVFK